VLGWNNGIVKRVYPYTLKPLDVQAGTAIALSVDILPTTLLLSPKQLDIVAGVEISASIDINVNHYPVVTKQLDLMLGVELSPLKETLNVNGKKLKYFTIETLYPSTQRTFSMDEKQTRSFVLKTTNNIFILSSSNNKRN
jgi:hypothetical protein